MVIALWWASTVALGRPPQHHTITITLPAWPAIVAYGRQGTSSHRMFYTREVRPRGRVHEIRTQAGGLSMTCSRFGRGVQVGVSFVGTSIRHASPSYCSASWVAWYSMCASEPSSRCTPIAKT